MSATFCPDCGEQLEIGAWPFCPDHGQPSRSKGFEPYMDYNISDKPVWITNAGDRNKLMRPYMKDDHWVHVQERGHSESYYRELNDRRAHRAEMERKERAK